MDKLENLLMVQGRPMNKQLIKWLERSLAQKIETWLSNEIEGGDFLAQEYPHIGPNTCYLMANAAITILAAIYDAETNLVSEGWLDANAAILPDDMM